MGERIPDDLLRHFEQYGQAHVFRWWDTLDVHAQRRFLAQLRSIDLELIQRLFREARVSSSLDAKAALAQDIDRATPPSGIVRLPQSPAENDVWCAASQTGDELLKAGRIGVILVAGGQGTRLGFPHPKGMYPIGPISKKSLFQMLAEQVLALTRRAGAPIPYYVMTSESTHDETVVFFEKHDYFGLDPRTVVFFSQGSLPAVDATTGALLLAERGRILTSPDGHGGLLGALAKAQLIENMAQRGVDYLFYHQVDNPAVKVCDPAFLGFHAERNADVSLKVLAKTSATEKLGLVVEIDGVTRIVEYSDLPVEQAEATDGSGGLRFWAGSPAIHIFSRVFFERLIENKSELPFHCAYKSVPCLDANGVLNTPDPDRPNACKFERFVFDALPYAEHVVIIEADRQREFHPVKNRKIDDTTADTPERVQQSLIELWKGWLRLAGAHVADDAVVEISPLFALDAEDVRNKLGSRTQFSGTIHLTG